MVSMFSGIEYMSRHVSVRLSKSLMSVENDRKLSKFLFFLLLAALLGNKLRRTQNAMNELD